VRGPTLAPVVSVALRVSYEGSAFSGYARQTGPDGRDRVRTVQGDLEHALELVYRRPVPTVCAGRTDAGVHAIGQVVGFELTPEEFAERPLDRLVFNIDGICDDGLEVTAACRAREGFSPRFDAVSREYRYRLVAGPVPPVFLAGHSWWVRRPLDEEAMRAAAAHLVGEHDFRSFCLAVSAEGRNTVREVRTIELLHEEHLGEGCLCVRVVGNAFLHNMVRILVGTLVEVGAGRRPSAWTADALAACDRAAAGPTAPAEGLTFWQVVYPAGAVSFPQRG